MNVVSPFVFAWHDVERSQDGHDRGPDRRVREMSADADTSTGAIRITYGIVIEFPVVAEEPFRLESFGVGIFGFVAGHGPT